MSHAQFLLITASGPDHPGITASLMKIIGRSNHKIMDIGQAVTHGLLSLSFVLDIYETESAQEDFPILKDLLFESKKLGLQLDFKVVEQQHLGRQTQETFILSCVSPEYITATFLRDLSGLLAQEKINIMRIDNVTGNQFKAIELTTHVPMNVNMNQFKQSLLNVSDNHKIDLAFLKENVYRRNKRLIVFDMDSTLIQTEVIDEMARYQKVEKEVMAITHLAMNGQMDFNESLKKRLALLAGMPRSALSEILETLPLTPGASEFIQTVKNLGYKVALISGGFSFFANALKEKLGLHYAFANELEFENDRLTGRVIGTIINGEQKALLVDLLAQQENISLEQVVAVGDEANDLPMLAKAGLGIAYHAKEIVKQQAQQHMSFGPMTSILYFLGITKILGDPNHH